MLLQPLSIRAALKLDTPAKRFTWASQQLYGALFPSPAVAANSYGVPAKTTANKGIVPSMNLLLSKMSSNLGAKEYSSTLLIPFNYAQYSRGVSLSRCLGELSLDAPLPYLGVLPLGEPILDTSTALTLEQYLLEQVASLIAQANNSEFSYKNHITLNVMQAYPPSPAPEVTIPCIEVVGTVSRTGQIGNNLYGDITGVAIG